MLVTAARFTEPWEAHLFRMLLEAEGLFAVVAFDQHASSNYSMSWALGGVRVLVVDEELDQALAIERRCRAREYEVELNREFGITDAPASGEPMPMWYRPDILFSCFVSLLAAGVFGVVAPFRANARRVRT
jgi:hypothetical protein